MCMSPFGVANRSRQKRNLHRPTFLNFLSAGDGRLYRIVIIFGNISVIRLSLRWCVPGNTTRHQHVSKLRFLTVFPPMLLFLYLRLPRDSLPCEKSHGSTTYCTGTTTCESCQSKKRRATSSAPLLLFPDVGIGMQPPTIVMWEPICSYTCGPRSQHLALSTRSHETTSFCQCHCSVKPSPFHPNAEAVTVLVHIFADIERLTNTRQRTHRKPPLSSSTPSPDPAKFSTSLTSLACAGRLCICTRQWCAHWQRLTCMVNALLGVMPWVFTRRHRTLHACRYRIFVAYASAENPSATYGDQGAENDGSIFPR